MQVSNREFRPLHMYRQVHLTSSRQILDITIPAVLRTTRDGASTLFANLGLDVLTPTACMNVLRFRRLSNDPLEVGGGDEVRFAPVPLLEDLLGRCTA